ncbi:MAG: peptide ABC transporter substrate-binding protein, partial [Patescibacteria group bacterium]
MKKLSMLLGLTLLFISITACSKPIEDKTVGKNDTPLNSAVVEDSDIAQLPATRIVTDHFERQVEIPSEIERVAIVYLLPLPSVMAVYLGGNVDNLVGMPPDSLNAAENSILARYSPDILNVSTKFYEGGQINMEELLNLNPDVVFFTGPPN